MDIANGDRPARSRFHAHLGIAIETGADGTERMRLPFRDDFCNTRDGIHGGLVATLLDMAMSQAVKRECSGPKGHATISLNINYFAPAGGDLIATASITRKGGSIVFTTGTVEDESGLAVANGNAVFRLLK